MTADGNRTMTMDGDPFPSLESLTTTCPHIDPSDLEATGLEYVHTAEGIDVLVHLTCGGIVVTE